MCVYFFSKDKRSTRGKIPASCILSIISISLWCSWVVIYFLFIYKRDTVYMGMGPTDEEKNYRVSSKKQYIFTVLSESIILIVTLAYWLMVSGQYRDLMNKKYDDEDAAKAKKEEEEKEAAKKKEEEEKAAAKAKKSE